MPEAKKSLSPRIKKALIYSGMIAVGVGLVLVMTEETERAPRPRPPETISLTGNADTRSVSLEAISRRLTDLETKETNEASELGAKVVQLQSQITNLTDTINALQREQQAKIDKAVSDVLANLPPSEPSGEIDFDVPQEDAQEARRVVEENRLAELYDSSQTQVVVPQPQQAPVIPAPEIRIYAAEREEPKEASFVSQLPDLQIPAGSIISAYLLTGLDAPTGTRAASQPVPVLMRIKKESILPNYALADVEDCHLLGGAFGDLGSQRVNIRGEVISCILRDNSAVEGSVKFFVAGEDGKNGLKGRLVSRAGRVLAAASAAALTQGLLNSLDETSTESIVLGTSSGPSGAISGASQGFDLLTEYYLDLAEQTFPVIEVVNGRWVDVVLTEMLTIKWKG